MKPSKPITTVMKYQAMTVQSLAIYLKQTQGGHNILPKILTTAHCLSVSMSGQNYNLNQRPDT